MVWYVVASCKPTAHAPSLEMAKGVLRVGHAHQVTVATSYP